MTLIHVKEQSQVDKEIIVVEEVVLLFLIRLTFLHPVAVEQQHRPYEDLLE